MALTDYAQFPENVDGEGDAFTLASKRTTTFMSSGMTLVESSPGRDITDTKWRCGAHEAPPQWGSCPCITGETAVGGTGRVRTVGNIFSRDG